MAEEAARQVSKCFHGKTKDQYCVFCETLKMQAAGTLKPPPLRRKIIPRVFTTVMETILPWCNAKIDNPLTASQMQSALETWARQEGEDDVLVS